MVNTFWRHRRWSIAEQTYGKATRNVCTSPPPPAIPESCVHNKGLTGKLFTMVSRAVAVILTRIGQPTEVNEMKRNWNLELINFSKMPGSPDEPEISGMKPFKFITRLIECNADYLPEPFFNLCSFWAWREYSQIRPTIKITIKKPSRLYTV